MIRAAQERIGTLFALAEGEARRGPGPFPSRYVALARRIGMRYNVRVPSGFREHYCRRCSAHWTEGRTVRTRLRGGVRVRSCIVCGAVRRVPVRPRTAGRREPDAAGAGAGRPSEAALVDPTSEPDDWGEGEEE